jgi:hypothetical protein
MLYRSTERLCRCGAAVKNLSHSASLKFPGKGAPSNPGIKHLGGRSPRSGRCSAETAGGSMAQRHRPGKGLRQVGQVQDRQGARRPGRADFSHCGNPQ